MSELPAADRFGVGRTDNPYWNENSWFSLTIPERRIHGLIQHFFRPNMGLLVGGPVLWDPSGTWQWNCLHYGWSHLQAAPGDAKKFDLKARNSLSVRVLEPLRRYKIDYDRAGFALDLVWEAIGPLHRMETGDPDQAKTAAFHAEQPGRMKGRIRRHGEELAVDCWSMRDCSSGPYDTETWPTGGYFWGIGPSGAFLTMCIGRLPELRTMGGFLLRDGQISTLAEGTRRVEEYGEFGPKRLTFNARDELGRTVKATGSVDPGLVFTGYTDHTVVWALTEWDCGGETWWGDNQEFYPAEAFRRIARGEYTLGGRGELSGSA
jgi:hypothetical protein